MSAENGTTATVRVAVTQLEPAWLDLQASVEKTCQYIAEAAQNGAQLVTFPEVFIPGYPTWIWSRPVDNELAIRYIKNSLKVDSPEMQTIKDAAAAHNITVALGFSENDKNSLYIAQAIISNEGKMLMRRRKMKATHMERTIFGDATGDSLLNVVPTPVGRVGALSCWEHIQPLLKYHTYHQNEEIHVSAWPQVYPHNGGDEFYCITADVTHAICQTYAMESQAFVLHTTGLMTKAGVDANKPGEGMLFSVPGGGTSAIFNPDGRKLSKDLGDKEEGVIYADLNMDEILKAKTLADAVVIIVVLICSGWARTPASAATTGGQATPASAAPTSARTTSGGHYYPSPGGSAGEKA